MKKKNLLLAGLMAVSLAACTPKTVSPSKNIKINIDCGGAGYLTILDDKGATVVDGEETSAYILELEEPAEYTFKANPNDGTVFLSWSKDGKEFSKEREITVMCDADAEYDAVFGPMPKPDGN